MYPPGYLILSIKFPQKHCFKYYWMNYFFIKYHSYYLKWNTFMIYKNCAIDRIEIQRFSRRCCVNLTLGKQLQRYLMSYWLISVRIWIVVLNILSQLFNFLGPTQFPDIPQCTPLPPIMGFIWFNNQID